MEIGDLLRICGVMALSVVLLGCQGQKPEVGKEVTTPSGLKYVDLVIGTGEVAKAGDRVFVHYTGKLEDGTQFDSSVGGNPFPFTPGEGRVIAGWEEGVPGMAIGGKRKLIIPPELGYGAAGAGGVIPPNATLIFEIELIKMR